MKGAVPPANPWDVRVEGLLIKTESEDAVYA